MSASARSHVQRRSTPEGEPPQRRTPLVVSGVLTLVGAVALLLAGGLHRSIGQDEAVSILLARDGWGDFADAVTSGEGNMALYYLLLRGWAPHSSSEVWLRLPSLLAVLGAIVVLVLLARRLRPGAEPFVPLFVVAQPLVLRFGQEVRSYGLVLLLVTVAGLLFVHAVRRSSTAAWLGWAVVSALAVYAHYFAAFVVPALLLSLLFAGEYRVRTRQVMGAVTLLAVLLLPLAALVTGGQGSRVAWAAASPAVPLLRLLVLGPLVVALLALVVLRLARPAAFARLAGQRRRVPWHVALALAWAVVPVVLAVVASVVQPLLVPRYFIVVVPGVVLVAAFAAHALLHRIGRPAAWAAAVAVAAVGLLAGVWYADRGFDDFRAAQEHVAAIAEPGDEVVLFAPFVRIPFEFYLDQDPATAARLDPAFPDGPWGGDTERYLEAVPVDTDALAADLDDADRVLVLLSHAGVYGEERAGVDEIQSVLEEGFTLAETEDVPGVTVQTWERRDG